MDLNTHEPHMYPSSMVTPVLKSHCPHKAECCVVSVCVRRGSEHERALGSPAAQPGRLLMHRRLLRRQKIALHNKRSTF